MVKSGQVVERMFTTEHPFTRSLTAADALPTGVLYVGVVASAAEVTVAIVSTGLHSVSVTIPEDLADGTPVALVVSATVDGVPAKGVLWEDVVDARLDAILEDTGATLPAAIAAASTKGSGDKQVRLTIKNTDDAIVADAEVTVTSDVAGDVFECGPVTTNALGKTPILLLSAGTYYRWASKTGETFTNPQPFTVV